MLLLPDGGGALPQALGAYLWEGVLHVVPEAKVKHLPCLLPATTTGAGVNHTVLVQQVHTSTQGRACRSRCARLALVAGADLRASTSCCVGGDSFFHTSFEDLSRSSCKP